MELITWSRESKGADGGSAHQHDAVIKLKLKAQKEVKMLLDKWIQKFFRWKKNDVNVETAL